MASRSNWSKAKKKGTSTFRPTGKENNVRVASTEMTCLRCRRVIYPGRDIFLMQRAFGVLPPDTPVACSSECRKRWKGMTVPATTTSGATGQILTNRPQLRDGKQPRPFGPIAEPAKTDAERETQRARVARQKPLSAKAVETRTEIRNGQQFTVYVLPERKRRKR